MDLSDLIRITRQQRGMTQQALGKATGYDPSYFSFVERGLRRLDDEGVVKVALALGIDPRVALLAGLRERLPRTLRHYLPEDPSPAVPAKESGKRPVSAKREAGKLPVSPSPTHSLMRQVQSEELDVEIGRYDVSVKSDWDGNLRTVRTLSGCRPTSPLRPVSEVSFQVGVLGAKASGAREPSFKVTQTPPNLQYKVVSSRSGVFQRHRLVFPTGWRRTTQKRNDSLSFAMATEQKRGLYLRAADYVADAGEAGVEVPVKGAVNASTRHLMNRLQISLELPAGYEPDDFDAWTWFGNGPLEMTTRNLGDRPCRTLKLRTNGNKAELTVLEPLAGYTFAILWTPLDAQRYIEARYGGRREIQL